MHSRLLCLGVGVDLSFNCLLYLGLTGSTQYLLPLQPILQQTLPPPASACAAVRLRLRTGWGGGSAEGRGGGCAAGVECAAVTPVVVRRGVAQGACIASLAPGGIGRARQRVNAPTIRFEAPGCAAARQRVNASNPFSPVSEHQTTAWPLETTMSNHSLATGMPQIGIARQRVHTSARVPDSPSGRISKLP